MFWLWITFFLTVLILLYKLLTPTSVHWKYGSVIPGPQPLPLIGNALVFYSKKTVLAAITAVIHQYGPVSRLWIGKQLFTLLTDPNDVEVFLSRTTHLNKSDSYRLLDSWLGTKGMLTGDADIWRIHRKLLAPSFHLKILECSISMIEKHAKILCEQLKSRVDQPEFDITDYIEKCSLDIICESAMGIDLQCQTAQHSQYLENLKIIRKIIVTRGVSPWLQPEFIFRMSVLGRMYFKTLEQEKKFIRGVITERKKMLISKSTPKELLHTHGVKKPKPFLDFILAESNFTDQEIEDEVQTIMFAGHDTTKAAISFCLYELSKNLQIQDKLIKEIDEIVSKKADNLTFQDYMGMKYLDLVTKETLRMYTPVPIIARKVEEDITLPSGYTLPAGSLANFCLINMHNNEKYFENPDQFKPERFENQERNLSMFIPFSAGPRNCVGQKFASAEMKIVLFTFFKKYRLLPAIKQKSITLETGIVLQALEGTPIRIINKN